MTYNELRSTLRKMQSAKKRIDAAQAEYDAYRDMLKLHMVATGAEEMVVGNWKLLLQTITSRKLDAKTLKAALPAVWRQFSTESTSQRFTVTANI